MKNLLEHDVANTPTPWGLSRWRRTVGKNPPLSLDITYFNPIKNVVGIRMSEIGEVSFLLNGNCVPYIPMPTRFVVIVRPDRGHLRDHEKEAWETWSDVERISAALHIDAMELENILPYVGDSGRFVQKVWVEEGTSSASEDDQEPQRSVLKVKLQTHGNFFPSFGMLSGGEQVYVLIEIGIAIARFSARYVPTILILDTFRTLDSAGQKEWARYLSEPEHLFQTIVEAHLDLNLTEMASSAAWEVVTLEGKPPWVEIHQIGATE